MKSGKYFSSGKNIAYEVERDAALVNREWSIEWHIDGKARSFPLYNKGGAEGNRGFTW